MGQCASWYQEVIAVHNLILFTTTASTVGNEADGQFQITGLFFDTTCQCGSIWPWVSWIYLMLTGMPRSISKTRYALVWFARWRWHNRFPLNTAYLAGNIMLNSIVKYVVSGGWQLKYGQSCDASWPYIRAWRLFLCRGWSQWMDYLHYNVSDRAGTPAIVTPTLCH